MNNLSSLFGAISGNLAEFILIAGVVERLSEFAKQTIQVKLNRELTALQKQIISTLIAVLLCVAASIKLLPTVAINLYVNMVLAGVVASLGSNFLHDLAGLLSSLKANSEQKKDN